MRHSAGSLAAGVVMSDNYIIEIRPESAGRSVQAGIVVREREGFRFFAAVDDFFGLEQRVFKTPQAAAEAALRHAEALSARRPGAPERGR
jgi:hypothetical protein